MSEPITYHELMQSYYWLNVPQQLGSDAHSLFSALVFKSSLFDFYYTEFNIPNSEMQRLAVLSERALYEARTKLTDFRLRSYPVVNSEESRSYSVVKYQKGKKSQCGVYTTFFDVLLAHASQRSVAIPEESRSNAVAIPLQSGDITTPVAVIYKKENLLSPEQDDKNSWLLEQLMRIAPGWGGPTNDDQREMISDILKYPQDKIQTVCKETGKKGITARMMLGWILKGLENYEQFYGDKDGAERPPRRDEHQEAVGGIGYHYDRYKDGKMKPDGFQSERTVYNNFRRKLDFVLANPDDFDFTVEEYQAAIQRWEGRS